MARRQTVVQWHEGMVNQMSTVARALDKQLATYTGERPFGSVRLSPAEQLAQYDTRREDDQFWKAMMDAGQWKEIESYVKRFEPLYTIGGSPNGVATAIGNPAEAGASVNGLPTGEPQS